MVEEHKNPTETLNEIDSLYYTEVIQGEGKNPFKRLLKCSLFFLEYEYSAHDTP